MSRSDAEHLEDSRAAISRCIAYCDHLDLLNRLDGLRRRPPQLAVIGEAVKSLPDDFKLEHAGPPWPSIAGLRNVVVHEYFRVNPDMVRDIVDDQLAPLLHDIG